MLRILRGVLTDVAKLKLPVTAAAVLATALALLQPFGIELGGDTTGEVTGALVAVGVVATFLQRYLGPAGGYDHDAAGILAPEDVEPGTSPAQPGT